MLKPKPTKEPIPQISKGLLTRLFSKIAVNPVRVFNGSACWEWAPPVNKKTGYAMFSVRKSMYLAHRFTYLLFAGPIPDGLVCDHLCRNKICVNPAHLEPVTPKINIQRGIWTKRSGARYKTHCKNGHAMTGSNVAFAQNPQNDGSRGGSLERRRCRR